MSESDRLRAEAVQIRKQFWNMPNGEERYALHERCTKLVVKARQLEQSESESAPAQGRLELGG
jgi:hypothetical protein